MSQPIASAYVDLSIDNSQFKADVGAANDLMLEFLGKMESAIGNFNMSGINAAFDEMAASVRMASEATARLRDVQAGAVEARLRLTESAQQARLAMQEEANAARLVTEAERADAIASGAEQKRQLATASSEVALRLKEEANAAKIAATEERSAQASATAEQKRQLAAESQAVTLRLKEEAAAARSTGEAEQQMATSTKEAGGAASEAGGHFSVFSGALSFLLGQMAYSAFSLVAQGLKDVAGGLISQNAALETASVAFTTLDKSASDANAEIAVLKDYANHTSFEFAGVKQSAIELQTAGSSAHDAETEIKKLGDAVAAMGGGDVQLQQLAEDVAQVQVKGHLAGQEVLQFANAGIPLVQILADKFGKTNEQIDTMISAGLIPAGAAIEALNGYIGTQFQGAADAQSKTFSGMVSTLQDWFNQSLQIVGKPLFEHLEGALTKLIDKLNDPSVNDALTKIGAVLGDTIGGAIDWLMNTGVPGMISAWSTLSGVFSTIWTVVSDVAGIFTTIAQDAFGWGQGIINSLANGISSSVGAVLDSLGGIGDVITGLLETHSPPKLLPQLTNWGKGAAQAWLDGWTTADFTVLNGVVDPVASYLNSLEKIGAISKTAVAPAIQAVTDAMTNMIATIKSGGTVGPDTFNAIAKAAGPAGDEAKKLAIAEVDVLEATQNVATAQTALDEATANVKTAQSDLNTEMAHYDELLAPIQAEIDGITASENALTEAQQRQKLENTIANAPLDREKAALQITIEQHDFNAKQQKLNDDISKQQDVLNNKHATAEEKAAALYQIQQDQAQLRINEIDDKEKVAALDQSSKDTATAQLAVLGQQKLNEQDKLKLIESQKAAAKIAGDARIKAAQDEVTHAQTLLTAAQNILTNSQDRLKNEQAVVTELTKENALIATQQAALTPTGGGGGGKKGAAGGSSGTKPKPPVEWHEPEMQPPAGGSSDGQTPLSKAIDLITTAFKNMVTEIGNFVNPILVAVNTLMTTAGHAAGQILATAITVANRTLTALKPTLETAREALVKIINAITELIPHVTPIIQNIIIIGGNLVTLVGQFLTPVFTALGNAFVAIQPHLADFFTAVGNLLGVIGEALPKLKPVAEFLGGVFATAVSILGKWWGFLLDVATNVTNWFAGQLKSALEGTNPIVNTVTGTLTTLGNFISGTLQPVIETIVGWVITNWPGISTAIDNAWKNFVQPAFQGISDFINNTLLPAIKAVIDWVNDHWPEISAQIKTTWEKDIQPALKFLGEKLSDLFGNFKDITTWVSNHWPEISSSITDTWNNVKGPIESIIKSLTDLYNIIVSVINKAGGLGAIADVLRNTPGIGAVLNGIIPSKADGGVIEGDYPGQPRLIIAHAGEVFHGLKGQYGPTLEQLTQGMMGSNTARMALPGVSPTRAMPTTPQKHTSITQNNYRTMYNPDDAYRDLQRMKFHVEGPG